MNDPKPLDFLEKMPDEDKELKLIAEDSANNFLKNQEPDNPDATKKERFLISSKAYSRKSNVTSDKALNLCWELHYRF